MVSKFPLNQRSPTFLAPGTGFVEDSFSMDRGWGDGLGIIQVQYIHCAIYFYCYYPTPLVVLCTEIMNNTLHHAPCALEVAIGS